MEHDPASDKDFIGTLDRSIVGLGLSFMAFIPTLLFAIFRPDKLLSLINSHFPKGRDGLILGPGIFFVLSTALHSLILSRFIGDGSALQVSQSVDNAVQGANLGKVLLAMFPNFIIAIFVALSIWLITRVRHKDWTMQHSVRTALYLGGFVQWVISPLERIASALGPVGSFERALAFSALFSVYIFFWFFLVFRKASVPKPSDAYVTAALMALIYGGLNYMNYHGFKLLVT